MTDLITLLSGWWAAAIFFTLWMRATLTKANHAEVKVATLLAAMLFASERLRRFPDSSVTFLRMFLADDQAEIAGSFPEWPAYRRRKILELTGEAA